jgi:predicted alpha-1,6-mannanase (GH76 family)
MLRQAVIFLISACALIPPACAQRNPLAYLQQAFNGVDTLQSWYAQNSGLYQTTGWWNSANAITVLANYSRLDGTNAYFPVFANTLQQAPKTNPGFLNNYYDDEGWWALAWVDVYDLTRKPEYLAAASSIFADMTGGWDNTCGGGIWWTKDRKYKNAIANELFLSVAASLAAHATNGAQRNTYLGWAQKEWSWFQRSGMINSQSLINDGLDFTTCKSNRGNSWSYNQGVVLGGLTQLSALTHDAALIGTAKAIADATLLHLTDANGVLHDVCEPKCGADGVQFKGIFLRNLMALQVSVHDPRYKEFADTNAKSIWNKSQGANYQFGQVWLGPFDAGDAGSQSSALDAFLAAAAMERSIAAAE